ncbi:MAG: cupin domain-containing protein [Paracoccaceae bacterium]
MNKIRFASPPATGPGIPSAPDADRVVEGAPRFTTWPSLEGPVDTGIWAATPGVHRMIRDNSVLEQFYIIEGEIELSEDGCTTPHRFGAGDLVVIEPGFRGTWRTITPVRKFYVTARI